MILGLVVIFGDFRNLWRFLGLLRGGKYCSSWSRLFILDTHTTFGWTWARRAREPVEVSCARKYFLVGWEVNLVSGQKEYPNRIRSSGASQLGYQNKYSSIYILLM